MADIQIPCPECNRNTGVNLEDVAKQRTATCPLGHRFTLIDEGGGARSVIETLKRFGG